MKFLCYHNAGVQEGIFSTQIPKKYTKREVA